MEDDMRKIITVAVIVVIATVTTAWAVSNPAITIKALGGGSAVAMHTPPLW
jgi:F0F1-type ATP synthase assembly protein I